jgi:hypothetical protein
MALDAKFWASLWRLAISADTRPEILLTVWFAESGLDPSARNSIGCIGLNQTCPKSIGGPGFPSTPEAYRAALASEQLAWIAPQVRAQVLLNGGGFRSAARCFQANLLPATLGTATRPADVVAAAAGPYADAYKANQQLDVSSDGTITLADLGDYLERVVVPRGLDASHGAPLETAIETAYAPQNLPQDALWTSPALTLHETSPGQPPGLPPLPPPPAPPAPPTARSGRGAVAMLTAAAGLVSALAIASRGQ